MQNIVIKLGLLTLILLTALPAVAQDRPTIRDINAIPQSQIDILNAGLENLTADDITANIYNELNGTDVTFEAVIMSDPRNSGLSNADGDGRVDRIHMFVRDTSAATLGPEGMGIQVVDGAYDTNNLLNFTVGDVIQITGGVTPFGTAMQVSPTTVTLLGNYVDLGLPDTILDPVVITTEEANSAVGEDGVQVNWNNLSMLRNQFVRVEDATILTRSLANPDRPDFYISTDGGTTILNFYDTGLRFRNDRAGQYPAEFNVREDDFEPGPPGSLINLQGFLVFQGGADQIGRGVPANGLLSIAPFEERGCEDPESGLQCDYEVLESPPIISGVSGPDFIPDGSAPVTISFVADADPTRTLTTTFCEYTTSESADPQTVTAAQNGDNLECEIPAQADGVFVTYQAGSTDNTGATSLSDPASYRTLADGIDSIADIQLTIDEGPGDSPFRNLTTDMNVMAYVASDPSVSGIITLQEDLELAPWTGIFLSQSENQPAQGDALNITNAEIVESFGVTTLQNATYTVVSSGNVVDYKVVPTDVLVDPSTAEAHEGMLIRFEDVTAGPNPDAPSDFGEWSFFSNSSADSASVRADDASQAIPQDFNVSVPEGTSMSFIQGIWWFSFGNYKLVPESPEDVGIGNVSNEDADLPNSFKLDQNYPNPFNPVTTISYEIPAAGLVTLEVFDLLGRSVSVLVNETIAAGQYTVDFDASGLSSGLYLYRLTTGERVETRKMLLLK